MDFSRFEINRSKIFKSFYDLQYRDPKLEEQYQLIAKVSLKKSFNLFSQFLLFFGIFLCTLEGVLFFSQQQRDKNRNLKYNFYFALVHLSITIGIFMYIILSNVIENKIMKNFCLLVIHFCYNNFFLSLISIIIVYFKMEIELVSFTFLLQILTNLLLSFFLHRNFWTSFVICLFNLAFEFSFLLGIHVIKGIIYYLVVHTAFTIISLGFVYMYEFMTRKFYFSFLKLAKEKDYFLETIEFFNISYFLTKNKTIKRAIKMDFILNKEDHDTKDKSPDDQITLKSIEKVMRNVICFEHFSKDIDNYLASSRNKKNFQFKKLIKIITNNEENKHHFKKFTNIGILCLKNSKAEESYVQMFMKMKIKKIRKGTFDSESDYYDQSIIYKNFDVKIECILLDVSQSFMKKETQFNSIVLSKYINDIKSPLFLLGQIISEFKSYMHSMKKTLPHAKSSIDSEIDEYSNNLRVISDNFNENIELINNFAKKQNFMNNPRIFPDCKQVDIRKFVNQCIEFYSLNSKFNKKKENIRVYSVIDNNIPQHVFTIESYFKQIVMNLLSNALKFTFNGEIKVVLKMKSKLELTQDRKFLEVDIIDTGIGIDEDNLNRICDQNELLISNKFQGAGLGLSIVTDLLKKINSKLCVCSVKNKGSNFSFEMPITNDCDRNELSKNTDSIIPRKEEIKTKKIAMNSDDILIRNKYHSLHAYKVIDPEVNKLKDKDSEEDELFDKKTVVCTQPSRQELKEISKKYCDYLKSDKKRSNSMDKSYKNFNFQTENLIINDKIIFNTKYKRRNSFLTIYNLPQPHSTNNPYKNRFLINGDCPDQNILCFKCMSLEEEKKDSENKMNFISNNNLEEANLSHSDLNIFVIDDDATYLNQTVSQINMISLELNISIKNRTACDAVESMCKIYEDFKNRQIVYDLIIIDENMPFLSGSTFVKMFNEYLVFNGFYKVPFISVSSEKVRIATQKNDSATHYFESFLTKPCRISVLKSIILKYIDAKKNN